MAIKVQMPALSPTMEEGNLAKWLVKEGDKIKAGDIIAEIETDKATMEYEASEEGVVAKIIVQDSTDDVKVNTVIAILKEEGDSDADVEKLLSSLEGNITTEAPQGKESSNKPDMPEHDDILGDLFGDMSDLKSNKKEEPAKQAVQLETNDGDRIFISPVARKIANDNNVDVSKITGSGPRGRIVKVDVEDFMAAPDVTAEDLLVDPTQIKEDTTVNPDEAVKIPVSGMRKTIAKRLVESKQTVPHYYLTIDCNMDNLLEARAKINAISKGEYRISVNDFLIKAVAVALREVPAMNVSWHEDYGLQYQTSDVAVAVAVDGGLITPIVRVAERKTLREISSEMKELVARAKEGKLSPNEYQGGSFSISNLGMFGIDAFSAIVNPPHAGILAIGATVQKPVVKDGNIVVSNMMKVTLSADHRVVDGAVGATFLAKVKQLINDPTLILL